jgi:hypothetical protein
MKQMLLIASFIAATLAANVSLSHHYEYLGNFMVDTKTCNKIFTEGKHVGHAFIRGECKYDTVGINGTCNPNDRVYDQDRFWILFNGKMYRVSLSYGSLILPPQIICRVTSDELKLNEEYLPSFQEQMDPSKHPK